jgi:hypothetical protein
VNIIVKALLVVLVPLTACAHGEPPVVRNDTFACPRPSIKTLKDPWSHDDEAMIPRFNEGCKKYFTKNHCPIRVLKSQNLSYQVTCKKVR